MTTLKGRELDAAIATQIMGWKRKGYYRDPYLETNSFYDIWFDYAKSRYMCDVREWKPFTNISHAFQVVEKMREEGFVMQLNNDFDGTWSCVFYKSMDDLMNPDSDSLFYALADTFPEAICLAALEAKGAGK